MKLIVAIIRQEKLDAVQAAQPVRQRMVQKTQLLLGVNDEYLEPAVQAILSSARTGDGEVGDGKIFVLPLEECVRIRTGERGGRAI